MTRLSTVLASTWLAAAVAASPAHAQKGPEPPRGLRGLTEWLDLPIFRDGRCGQFSSFDRTGGNDDSGHYLEVRGNRALLAAIDGPGCVTRIWSANPSGTFLLFLDGDTVPRLRCAFADLFQNKYPPFVPPLAGRSSGGWYSVVPIPFLRSCRIEVEGAEPFYYQVDYASYPDARGLATFQTEMSRQEKESFDRAILQQKRAGDAPFFAEPGDRQSSGKVGLAPGETVRVLDDAGSGDVLSLRLKVTPATRETLRGLLLLARWNGEDDPSIASPVGDFFGNAFGPKPFKSLPIGVDSAGWFYCYFPMPYAKGARIDVVNDGLEPVSGLEWAIAYRSSRPLPADVAGAFHARWHRATTVAGQPFRIVEAVGEGHYVGCSLAMQGTNGIHFLEGDEQAFVDGEKQPSIVGTGTEDFFSSGWYFNTGEFALPLHGCVVKDEAVSRVAAYRFQIGDCIPFRKSLALDIEHGGQNDYPGADYASVAYWYQKEPHSTWSPVPPYSARQLAPVRVLGAVEAEDLALEPVKGAVPPSATAEPSFPGEFSGGRCVTFDGREPGDAFRIAVPCAETGVVALVAGVARGRDGGRFQMSVEGTPLTTLVDFSKDAPDARVDVEIGRLRATAGSTIPLLVTAAERSTDAPGSRLRLDYFRVLPPHREDRAVEAESLAFSGESPSHEARSCAVEDARLPWSGGSQVLFAATAPGDAARFTFEAPVAAEYEIAIDVTKGPAYGSFQTFVDDTAGAQFDAWAEAETAGTWVTVARSLPLAAGPHTLKLAATIPDHPGGVFAIGLDAVRLRNLPIRNALEGESLSIAKVVRGTAERQGMSGFGPGWSGEAQLLFAAAAAGASFEAEVPVAATALVDVAVWFTRAPDYGHVALEIDGSPVGMPFDGYSERVAPAGRVSLGVKHLAAGGHRFRFVVTGKNERSAGFSAGIDAIELAPASPQR